MIRTNCSYTIELKTAHLNWGTHRHTDTRPLIYGEGYIPIPREYARAFELTVGLCFTAVFADGFSSFRVKAAGNAYAGDPYAKQFQGSGDLKAFGSWFQAVNAQSGDRVEVLFIDENTVRFELLQ